LETENIHIGGMIYDGYINKIWETKKAYFDGLDENKSLLPTLPLRFISICISSNSG
jgi:hypothetical protein